MKRPLPAVVIVGRPNVGKSSFFNRILGQRLAIVEDEPGVTRDRHFARAEWQGRAFYIVDTGGLEPESDEPMAAAIRRQVLAAIEEADVLAFIVDGKTGPHPLDASIADMLRAVDVPVVLIVNKMDRLPEDIAHLDFWELGIGEPLAVSAISGKGSGDVLDEIVAKLPPPAEVEEEAALRVAVIGKPNVGKSSFVNRLLGEERMVVNEVAGTTRDSVDTPLRYHGRTLVFIDTAGLRRQARIDPGLEYYASLRTERVIEQADICLLLIDASDEAHVQDLKVANKAWDAGCGLIIVANKWDLVEKDEKTSEAFATRLRERAPQLKDVPIVFTSALTGQRVQKVLDLVLEVAEERRKRISTSQVNEALAELATRHPPPHHRGMVVKLQYATQIADSPPTFAIFVNHVKGITESYERYLVNGFRERWGFAGTPIRLRFRGRREERG